VNIPTPAAMRSLGNALGKAILAADGEALVLAIDGELGAGKTTLVGGILNAMSIAGPARSPTYTLIEPYECGPRQIYHLDLYRLSDPREVEALGVRDMLTQHAVLLIEWPERGAGMLPVADLGISIRYADAQGVDERAVTLAAGSVRGEQLLKGIASVQ
jgi:tRNA threonylcarbamoyladenosine biosynthesis protein TsaE